MSTVKTASGTYKDIKTGKEYATKALAQAAGGSSSSSPSVSNTPMTKTSSSGSSTIKPLTIDSGLSAADQAAVSKAYTQGGGSASNITYSNPSPVVPPTPTQTIGSSGLTASQVTSSIPTMPSADEILNNVLNSSGFQNFQQSQQLGKTLATGNAESQKAQLEKSSIADTKSFIDSMGRRGLFFSGETNTGLQDLAESLASSKLNIDRNLAGTLLQSDFKTRDTIINMVEDTVKQAQAGRKEALDALEKAGLTIIGDQIVPTLAAQNAELSQQREDRIAAQQDLTNQINAAKNELSMAKSEIAIDTATLKLERLQQQAANSTDKEIAALSKQLTASAGADGYTDPNLYARLRQAAAMNPTQFDNRFGYLINPLSKDRLGLGTASKSGLTSDQQSIINDAKARIDYAKQTYENVPAIRDAVIQAAQQQFNFDVSPYL